MSSFPNILQVGESGLDDFPEEVPSPARFRPPPPSLTFAEDFADDSPADRVAIRPLPAVQVAPTRRRRGVLFAAVLGVAAGAIGGFLIFEPFSQDQTASLPFQPPATVETLTEPEPQPTPQQIAQANPPEVQASATAVPSRGVSASRPVAATLPPAIAPPSRPTAPASVPTEPKDVAVSTPAPAPSTAASIPTLSATPPVARVEQPAALAASPPPATRAEAPPTEVQPSAPAPARVEVSLVEPAAVLVAPVRPADEHSAIGAAIGRYQAAYGNRDAAAVKQVWPSANEAALAKAFANLESQNVAFYGCRTTVDGSTARTSCEGQVSYVARVGNRSSRTQNRDWTFTLSRKSADDWQIDGVAIR